MNGYDTVFANAKDEELEFETMFDQEDDLIDTIVGCNENGDPLTGADPCPAKTADERSCDDCNPDYEKDIDADDTNAPKDAEGTVGYDFETTPEYDGKVDDSTVPEAEPVEGEDDYQDGKVDSDKGVEDTVTGTIDNDEDVMEAVFREAMDDNDLGYQDADTEEERITDAPLQTPDDIEDVAKKVSEDFDFCLEEDEEIVKNSDKGVEDTVTGTIENDKDIEETFDFYLDEAEDPLNGQDTNSEVNAKERSCDDCNPDYEKDIDADDTKNAPKDAEGTVGYDFETTPEYNGKVDDSTTVDAKDVKIEEEGEIDFEFSTTIPKDAEGTVGYDIEVNPEIGSKDDDSTVDAKDVKIDEEGEIDFDFEAPEGSHPTVPEEEPNTEPVDDKCCEDVDFEFAEAASEEEVDGIDKDVESIEDPETYLDDDAIEDVESKDPKVTLDYDPSDEEVIDFVIKN